MGEPLEAGVTASPGTGHMAQAAAWHLHAISTGPAGGLHVGLVGCGGADDSWQPGGTVGRSQWRRRGHDLACRRRMNRVRVFPVVSWRGRVGARG